jgi:hypothetical protein
MLARVNAGLGFRQPPAQAEAGDAIGVGIEIVAQELPRLCAEEGRIDGHIDEAAERYGR